MDSSPEMLQKATETVKGEGVQFVEADLNGWEMPGEQVDLIFSNATFHWLRQGKRIGLIARLMKGLRKGGILAFQVPDNYHAPSHTLMRSVACTPNALWTPYFAHTRIGDLTDPTRPDLDPIETPNELWEVLMGAGAERVDVWRTEYFHVLEGGARAIVEWVKGTGLMPYLERIKGDEGAEEAKEAFLAEFERRIGEVEEYKLPDGKVLLGYPRLFVVGVKG